MQKTFKNSDLRLGINDNRYAGDPADADDIQQRALVHLGNATTKQDLLVINFNNDFRSGVAIGSKVFINGDLTLNSASSLKFADNSILANYWNKSATTISYTGNVGINTVDTKGYAFAVNGNVIASAVRVKPFSSWPDYVFEKDYSLMPLDSLQEYINHQKHLPNVPSAAQVQSQDQDLGEMNAILLRKVEELTLYILEQEKRIKALENK